jgi:hypothetical protein
MTPIDQIIQDYRSAFKVKGYTPGALGDFAEPGDFLKKLSGQMKTLNELQVDGVSLFVVKMRAEMDDKRYPIDLTFYFAYRSSNQDLHLISLDAELYDNKIPFDLLGSPLSNLPKLSDISKALRVDDLKKIRDQWEQSKRSPPGKRKGIGPR